MQFLRTPDSRFANLPGFPYEPHYLEVDDTEGGTLRVHYVDEGPRDGAVVLCLHGEPTWSYLYRKMIPVLVDAGLRVVAPDHVGFGRSDKPVRRDDYTYERFVDWTRSVVLQLELDRITLFAQDWGGLIGLRVLSEIPERFAAVVASNTFLPTGEGASQGFLRWREVSQQMDPFDVGSVIRMGTVGVVEDDVVAAYEAPFPDETYKCGAKQFPMLVPTELDDPAVPANRAAWQVLQRWNKPFVTAFGDGDPVTGGLDRFFHERIPGTQGQAHTTLEAAGHFSQEDQGEALAGIVVDLIRAR